MFFMDPTFIIVIPAFILSIYAQIKVHKTANKYKQFEINSKLNGEEIARKVLKTAGLNLPIIETPGELSDHYDPIKRELHLSKDVFRGTSITACGIAAHEAGHAIQHALNYKPLIIRTTSYPLARFGSFGGPILFMLGMIFAVPSFLFYGIIFYSLSVLFYLITLPVEFDASSRAKKVLYENGFVTTEEREKISEVLNSAALTYVAAALTAILELLRLVLLYNSRRD